MKCDDDTFVRVPLVLQLLNEAVSPGSSVYMGSFSYQSTPHRDRKNKWYISYEDWSKPEFPPFAHGPGYVVSRDLMQFFADEDASGQVSEASSTSLILMERDMTFHCDVFGFGQLKVLPLEDVGLATWVDDATQVCFAEVLFHDSLNHPLLRTSSLIKFCSAISR